MGLFLYFFWGFHSDNHSHIDKRKTFSLLRLLFETFFFLFANTGGIIFIYLSIFFLLFASDRHFFHFAHIFAQVI